MPIKPYDIIALTLPIPTIHKETKQPIQLQPGQVGTVLMDFDGQAFLIDFADNQGHTYAMETVPARQLLLLLHEPQLTNA